MRRKKQNASDAQELQADQNQNKSAREIRVREVRFDDETAEQDRPSRNTELGIVTYSFVLLFLILIGYLTYLNVFRVSDLNASVYNSKNDVNMDKYVRGSIISADGNVLAETQMLWDGTEVRVYPYYNMFAHVVGYSVNGKAGLESVCNNDLLSSHASILSQLKENDGTKEHGDNLILTLDTTVQRAAYEALGGYNGAVIAMEPSTGRILAMVSKPDFDPNIIADIWDSVVNDSSSSILLNRATQGLYPPGSIFKILTTLAYMRQQPGSYRDFQYDCTSSVTQGDVTISCYADSVHGTEDLKSAFAHSCNTAYATIGLELDPEEFADLCDDFLFNRALPTNMMHSTSQFVLGKKSGYAEKMMTAIGQGNTLVTPLHMALITCAVANGGQLMRPYLVDHMEAYDGTVVSQTTPSRYRRLMTSEEARILKEYMAETVNSGTATQLSWYGFTAAGKTGSAEYVSNGYEGTHSWFVGFSNVEDPDLVVAVIAEDGGTGSETAVPIAAQVFQAYYSR